MKDIKQRNFLLQFVRGQPIYILDYREKPLVRYIVVSSAIWCNNGASNQVSMLLCDKCIRLYAMLHSLYDVIVDLL